MAIILLTTGFAEPNEERLREYLACISFNLQNTLFSRLVVFLESGKQHYLRIFGDDQRLTLIDLGRRATYTDLFQFANTECPRDIVAVANADIYFDGSLSSLVGYDLVGKFLALSRLDDGLPVEYPYACQDAWIFQPPTTICGDFYFGVAGCDNRIARLALDSGANVFNPMSDIKAHHLHRIQTRHYDPSKTVSGLYAYVELRGLR